MDVKRVGAELAVSGTREELDHVVSSAVVMETDIEKENIRAGLDSDTIDGQMVALRGRIGNASVEGGVHTANITLGMADLANRGARMALVEAKRMHAIFGAGGRLVTYPLHEQSSGFREVANKLGPVLKAIELERTNSQ